jgi:hypothetical protein
MQLGKELGAGFVTDDAEANADGQAELPPDRAGTPEPEAPPARAPEPEPAAAG